LGSPVGNGYRATGDRRIVVVGTRNRRQPFQLRNMSVDPPRNLISSICWLDIGETRVVTVTRKVIFDKSQWMAQSETKQTDRYRLRNA